MGNSIILTDIISKIPVLEVHQFTVRMVYFGTRILEFFEISMSEIHFEEQGKSSDCITISAIEIY